MSSPCDHLLDVKWLREHFSYHPRGYLIRRKRIWRTRTFVGQKVTGTAHHSGYRYLRIRGRMVAMHRVVFTLVQGRKPKHDIDHIDRNRANNKIGNLREATGCQNNFNSKLHSRNTSGYRGVFWDKRDKLWYAAIQINGERKKLKFSKDKNLVVKAYRLAAQKALAGWFRC